MEFSVGRILGLLALALFSASSAVAVVPVEVRRYFRCHERLTSTRVSSTDTRLTQIKAGTLTGAAACAQLLDAAALGANNQVSTSDPRNQKILRKLNEVHRSFIAIPDFFSSFEADSTGNVIDAYEVANAFNYYVLKPNQTLSQILVDPKSYRAIRTATAGSTRTLLNSNYALAVHDANDAVYIPNQYAKEGILVGVVPDTVVNTIPPKSSNNQLTDYDQPNFTAANVVSMNVNRNLGAGLIGTQSYALATEANPGMVSNGGLKSRRRFMKYVFKDFLCRDLPAVRQVDVTSEVSTTSTLPYRNGATCVQCHSSMDKGAAVMRNLDAVRSVGGMNGMTFMASRIPDMPKLNASNATENIFPISADADFFKRPPDGAFFFRSYDGALVNQPLTSVTDLASKISQEKGFYACIASKYYKALTGISVNLGDINDSAKPLNLSSGETFHRNQVINLGTNLQSTQSLRTLILDIINSAAFISPDLGQ